MTDPFDVAWWTYKRREHMQPPVDEKRCRMSVPDGGRSVRSHQCHFKAKHLIDGYGFCTQHAARINRRKAIGY